MRRILFALCLVAAIVGMAVPASAQYMYLDSNGDGIHSSADRLNPNGTPTTVDVWLTTNANRDGSGAVCNTSDGVLQINSYAVNLLVQGGLVSYSGFVNRQTTDSTRTDSAVRSPTRSRQAVRTGS
jgi:hypothetical protein